VPVIFLSALTETTDKLEAFRAGGVDYITKPFQVEEVQARVETHLRIRALQQALEGSNRELAAANEELRALEALRDDFVHMLVHDMRSPLTVIGGCLDLLAMSEPPLPPDAAALLHDAKGSVTALIGMVSSVLDVSRMRAGKLALAKEPCDLSALTSEVFVQLRLPCGKRKLCIAAPNPAPIVSADRDLVVRIMQNILSNAIRFTDPRKGEITVQLQALPQGAKITVTDNGIGIPPEHARRIFEKFNPADSSAAARKSSTGLGLTFCKLAVEAHSGRIGVESTPGKGSSFWFELPPS
jgi:two-component system, sensor histidine kinase and response regulator